jgi:hypothetical protein
VTRGFNSGTNIRKRATNAAKGSAFCFRPITKILPVIDGRPTIRNGISACKILGIFSVCVPYLNYQGPVDLALKFDVLDVGFVVFQEQDDFSGAKNNNQVTHIVAHNYCGGDCVYGEVKLK